MKILVDEIALNKVLRALLGEDYLIRELQAMQRSPLKTANPIDTLLTDYSNAQQPPSNSE